MTRSLRLHHELLLLALSDEKGTIAFGSMLTLGLGGALLTELLLEKRIAIVHEGRGGKKHYVEVRDTKPLGEAVLDDALAKLASAKKRAVASTIVSRLGNLPRLRHAVALELCERGVLRESEQQILVLFRRRVYPTVDSAPEQALIRRIKGVVDGGAPPDERSAALIGIADLTGTLAAIYDRSERKLRKDRLKRIVESSAGSQAAGQAIAAAHAAIMVATSAAVIAAT